MNIEFKSNKICMSNQGQNSEMELEKHIKAYKIEELLKKFEPLMYKQEIIDAMCDKLYRTFYNRVAVLWDGSLFIATEEDTRGEYYYKYELVATQERFFLFREEDGLQELKKLIGDREDIPEKYLKQIYLEIVCVKEFDNDIEMSKDFMENLIKEEVEFNFEAYSNSPKVKINLNSDKLKRESDYVKSAINASMGLAYDKNDQQYLVCVCESGRELELKFAKRSFVSKKDLKDNFEKILKYLINNRITTIYHPIENMLRKLNASKEVSLLTNEQQLRIKNLFEDIKASVPENVLKNCQGNNDTERIINYIRKLL